MELIDAVPSRCAELLAEGNVEAALVPVIEYQRIDGLSVVPEVCVGSRESVRSVVLASKKADLKDVRSVALDESSRTSATLLKIIFREFLNSDPQWIGCAPDLKRMLQDNDAALVIGDPGMTFARAGLRVFDMASLWREYTGRGFVFAMWMIRDDASLSCRQIDFDSACTEGLSRAEEIVDFYQPRLGLPRAELFTYLRDNISFRLDADLRSGLELYYQLAERHALIPRVKALNLLAR